MLVFNSKGVTNIEHGQHTIDLPSKNGWVPPLVFCMFTRPGTSVKPMVFWGILGDMAGEPSEKTMKLALTLARHRVAEVAEALPLGVGSCWLLLVDGWWMVWSKLTNQVWGIIVFYTFLYVYSFLFAHTCMAQEVLKVYTLLIFCIANRGARQGSMPIAVHQYPPVIYCKHSYGTSPFWWPYQHLWINLENLNCVLFQLLNATCIICSLFQIWRYQHKVIHICFTHGDAPRLLCVFFR